VYYPLAAAWPQPFQSISRHGGHREVTGGSVDNLKLIGSGKPYIALTMATRPGRLQGEDKFKATRSRCAR